VPNALFEKLYQAELDRRNALQGETSLPLGILALLGSGLIVLLKEYESDGGVLDALFWGAFACASLSYVLAIYMLVRSFYGYVYRHLPFPSELRRYRDRLREHHRATGTPYLADREFEEFLEHNLMEAADRNTEHNLKRVTYLHKTNRAIIITLVAVAFTAVPYSIAERTREPPPQKVEITRIARAAMRYDVTRSPPSTTTTMPHMPVEPSNAPSMPPRPVPPSNFDVTTGVRAPKPSPLAVPRSPLEPRNFDERAGARPK